MENYKVLERLGEGLQGSVFLAEDKLVPGDKCVLKKVECMDRIEANKAFKEAVLLQQLEHPYICSHRDLFVVWDNKEQAFFVCLVANYYPLGDLEHTLEQHRAKHEFLESLLLKQWVGQLVEALHWVHQKQMIHRDLKPSNIFLRDDHSLTVGDFGVATVMDKIRTKTRAPGGIIQWMAPEISEASPHYDERTDVWSLGCIILAMATCAFMDSLQISGMLFRLRSSPHVLEEVLETVGRHYSTDLCQLIQTMLRRTRRPTMRELIDLSFVQECLALSSSPLYNASKDIAQPVPKENIGAVIAYMKENAQSLACQLQALRCLQSLTESHDHSMDDESKRQLLWTMSHFLSSSEVQDFCCQVLGNVAITASEDDVVYTTEFIQPVCTAMRSHAGSVEVQTSALALLMALSSSASAAEVLGREGGIQGVLASLRSFPANLEVASHCCAILWNLCTGVSNVGIIMKEKGVQDVCCVLNNHSSCRELVEVASSTLWALSMEDDNVNIMADLGVVELLLRVLEKHFQDPSIANFVCIVLASLIRLHDISAFHLIHTESGMEGIPVVLKVLKTHSHNGEVVESIAALFQELAGYEDIREELVSQKIGNTLAKLNTMFDENGVEQEAVSRALAALEQNSTPN